MKSQANRIVRRWLSRDWPCKCGCGRNIIDWGLISMMWKAQIQIGENNPIMFHQVNKCKDFENGSLNYNGKAAIWHVKGWTKEQLNKFVEDNWGVCKIFHGGVCFYEDSDFPVVYTDIGSLRRW